MTITFRAFTRTGRFVHLCIHLKFLEQEGLARDKSGSPRFEALTVAWSQEIGNKVDNTASQPASQLASQLAGLAPRRPCIP